jgi:O-antigen/teichoic acid export membrane protein
MDKIESVNNKKIAKNTLLLYMRMLFLMAINLYTSRIVLSALGVTDYGIYNAVGGFVAMFTVISGAMATATQRFLSFEIGAKNKEKIAKVFSTAIVIHIFLALIILLLAETVGLWFLNNNMIFPVERYVAANWVFQLSVLTLIINVISVPYNAALIAFEKMSAFAYISIYEGVLKLVIAIVISFFSKDKLILYALLLCFVSASVRVIYSIYVKKNLHDCKNSWRMNKDVRKEMVSFVSWNLIGSSAGILQEQGISIILNMFFGVAVNAARGVSTQVMHAVSGFVSNFNLAMNPQIVKSYSSGNREDTFKLAIQGSKFSFMMMMLLSTPIIINTPYILDLWLVEVPEYASIFVRIVLITELINSMRYTLVTTVHASGKVKLYQLTNGIISLMAIPIAYLLLKLGFSPVAALITNMGIAFVCHFMRLWVLWRILMFPVWLYLKNVTIRMTVLAIITYSVPVLLSYWISDSTVGFITLCFISISFSFFTCYLIGMTITERVLVMNKAKKVISKYIKIK